MNTLQPLPEWDMGMLFDSERFVVVALASQHGTLYEIVDKDAAQEVVLTGAVAEGFMAMRERWNTVTPHEDEVEAVLEAYLSLARLPLCIH